MDKKDWDKIVEEPVSEGLKARTLARARQELDQRPKGLSLSWKWLAPLLPGLAALLFYLNTDEESSGGAEFTADLDFIDDLSDLSDVDLANWDQEVIDELDLLEDLEFLEEWDEQSEES